MVKCNLHLVVIAKILDVLVVTFTWLQLQTVKVPSKEKMLDGLILMVALVKTLLKFFASLTHKKLVLFQALARSPMELMDLDIAVSVIMEI